MCFFYAFSTIRIDIMMGFVAKAELTPFLSLLLLHLPITDLTYIWQLLPTMLDDKSATAKGATPPHLDIVAAVYPGVLLLCPFLQVPRPKCLYPKLGFFAAL